MEIWLADSYILSNIFDIGAKIATPLALLGFAVAAWLAWSTAKSRQETKKLEMLPEEDRVTIVDDMLTRYGIDGRNMKRDDKFTLIREEMRKRFAAKRLTLIVIAVSCLLCFAIAATSTLLKGAADAKVEAEAAAAEVKAKAEAEATEADAKAQAEEVKRKRQAREKELGELKLLVRSVMEELVKKGSLSEQLVRYSSSADEDGWSNIKDEIGRLDNKITKLEMIMEGLKGDFIFKQDEVYQELLNAIDKKKLAYSKLKVMSFMDSKDNVAQIRAIATTVNNLQEVIQRVQKALTSYMDTLAETSHL